MVVKEQTCPKTLQNILEFWDSKLGRLFHKTLCPKVPPDLPTAVHTSTYEHFHHKYTKVTSTYTLKYFLPTSVLSYECVLQKKGTD